MPYTATYSFVVFTDVKINNINCKVEQLCQIAYFYSILKPKAVE